MLLFVFLPTYHYFSNHIEELIIPDCTKCIERI